MSVWTEALPYFPKSQLACKGSGVVKLDIRFAVLLPLLREKWGKALTPSSVCRTPKHNTAVKGHPNSLHLTENPTHKTNGTCAADIRWADWTVSEQLRFAKLAYSLGFSVGLHKSFCHIDLRTIAGLPQSVFLYGTWTGAFKPAKILEQ